MVIKERLEISKELQRKINNLGNFNGQKLKLVEGSIITIPKTNIAYIEPYKLEIGSDTYLIFGKNEIMYISKNNITNKISLQELEEVIRNAKNIKDRLAFNELLEDIKSKKINTIVALKLDRVTRSIYDWEFIMKFLEENEAYIDCANDEVNTTTANGKMISRLLMSVSQNEIERTSERIKMGLVGAIKEGHIPMKNLTGYKRVNKKLAPDEEIKDVVIDIFNKYLSGWSLQKIMNDLNKRNALNKKWLYSHVENIINNIIYKHKEKSHTINELKGTELFVIVLFCGILITPNVLVYYF